MIAVALFFFACEDETSLLGYPNPNSKFNVRYIEIPITSSVMLIDSIRTSNFYQEELNRVLVGKYTDPKFGDITATAFTQIVPTTTSKLDATAEVDSVTLQIRFDYYQYGATGNTPQSFSIHELTEKMEDTLYSYYFNKSTVPYGAAIGSKSASVSEEDFEIQYAKADNAKDTTLVKFTLDNSLGQKLFERAKAGDSTYTNSRYFAEYIKGLAIVPTSNDKVVGFDLNNSLDVNSLITRLTVHYHTSTTDSLMLHFGLSRIQFTNIQADRSASELSELAAFNQPVEPSSGLRYVQSGTGVVTKLDFSNFYDYVDADSLQNIIINSAELVITGTESTDQYAPVNALSLRMLADDNTIKKVKTATDTSSIIAYGGTVGISDQIFTVQGDSRSSFILGKASGSNKYSGFMTLFAQQMYLKAENKPRYKYFALYPESPPIGKGVHRLAFNKDNIKLRLFYTKPTINSNQ
jgi:hypothetical protein